ncbi:TPA: hypothetical protein ACH3X1_000239 [Trebouxia sp. C0004]
MTQAQTAWRNLQGSQLVSSDDESWLEQSGFHLSGDSEEDEVHSRTAQAYVRAVHSLKGPGLHRQRLPHLNQVLPLLLELPCRSLPSQADVLHEQAFSDKALSVPQSLPVSATPLAEHIPVQQTTDDLFTPETPQVQSQAPDTSLASESGAIAAQQHIKHALEMLFPQELPTQPNLQSAVSLAGHAASASTSDAVPAGQQQPQQLETSHADTHQQQQRLVSPASQLASAPFTGPVPQALSQLQQQQRQQGRAEHVGSQNHPVEADLPVHSGSLQLSLSAEQIGLLQAAADNAQRYLDKDAADGNAAGHISSNSEGTGPVTATQQTAQWDMQTAIVDAFKSILPPEARPQPAMSSGNSAAAIGAAHKPVPHASPSSELTHVRDLPTAAANDPVAAQANDSQAAAGSVPSAVLANDLRLAAQFSAAKAGSGRSAQANVSMPAAPQGKQSQSAEGKDSLPAQDSSSLLVQTRGLGAAQTPDPPAALPQPEPAVIPQLVSDASAGVGVTVQPEALQAAALQAAKAKAAADIVAAVRAARKAAAVTMAPADSTAAPADTDSAAMPAITKPPAPAMTAAAAAAVPAAVSTVTAPAATVTRAPPLPGAASISATAAVTSAPIARPTAPAAPSLAMAAQAAASASDAAAGLSSIFSNPFAAWSLPAAPIFRSSTATASTFPAAIPKFSITDAKRFLQSSVPQVPASVASRPVASTLSLHPQAVPATNTAAAVKPVSSTVVSMAASPGTAPVPVSLPGTTAENPPMPSSLAAFLSAHAPRALLQGSDGSSSSNVPDGSFTLPPPMPHQTSAIRAAANSPGSKATWPVSERPASLVLGAGLSQTGLPLLPHITPTPSPAPPPSQLPLDLTSGPGQAEGFTSIPASPSLFSPALQTAHAVAKLRGSKSSKKRNREQAQLTLSEPVTASQTNGTGQAPFSFLSSRESQQVSASLAPPKLAQRSVDDNPYPKRLHSDDGIPISKELAIMRKAHGNSFIPRVGADAVSSQLRDVKSLVLYKHKFNLLDICNAIGYFAIGQQQKLEVFLGDSHNSLVHQQQIHSIAALFGVRAFQSQHPGRFHEKYHLTELVKRPEAGILTLHGDMLVYFILELAELTKLSNKRGGEKYRREQKATLELANAVGRKMKGGGPDALTKGCVLRLQQLSDKGYLAVKRPKGAKQQHKPVLYPGWQGRPRYGPPTSTSLPPAVPQLLPPPSPQPATAVAAPVKQTTPPPATAMALSAQQKPAVKPRPIAPTQLPASSASAPHNPIATPAPLQSAMAAYLSPPVHLMPAASVAAAAASPVLDSQIPSLQHTSTSQAAAGALTAVPTAALGSDHTQRPLSDTTAALVAAVGPLFEAFVAQTEAVVTDPSLSLQGLTGCITQELAAAIATAAVKVIETRRQQSTAGVLGPAKPLALQAAEPTAAVVTMSASVPASTPSPPESLLPATTPVPAAAGFPSPTSPPALLSQSPAGATPTLASTPAAGSVATAGSVEASLPASQGRSTAASKPVAAAVVTDALTPAAAAPAAIPSSTASAAVATQRGPVPPASSGASPPAAMVSTAATVLLPVLTPAAKQAAAGSNSQPGKVRSDAATHAAAPAAAAAPARAAQAVSKPVVPSGNTSTATGKSSEALSANLLKDKADGHSRDKTTLHKSDARRDELAEFFKVGTPGSTRLLKRNSSTATASKMGDTKKQRTAVTTNKGAVEFEGYVVPGVHVNKYEPSSGKAEGSAYPAKAAGKHGQGRGVTASRLAVEKQARDRASVFGSGAGKHGKGQKSSRTSSPTSRSSRGSGMNSPASSGPLHASSRGHSHSQRLGSPQGLSRHNSGSPFQLGNGRPSRMSGGYGMSTSPMLSAPLPFAPQVSVCDVQLGEPLGHVGFRPTGMMGPFPGMIQGPQTGMGNGFPSHMIPPGPGDWQLSGAHAFPMPPHLMPGYKDAPDFSLAN